MTIINIAVCVSKGIKFRGTFVDRAKKPAKRPHRNWNLSIPVPRIVGNCFHRGYVAARLLCLKSNCMDGDINYCAVLQSVAFSETLTL